MEEIKKSEAALRHYLSVDQLHDRRKSGGRKPNKLRRRSLYNDQDTRSLRLSISSRRYVESPFPPETPEPVLDIASSTNELPTGTFTERVTLLIL